MNREMIDHIIKIENAIEELAEYFEYTITTTGFVRKKIEKELGKAQFYLNRLSRELEDNNENY